MLQRISYSPWPGGSVLPLGCGDTVIEGLLWCEQEAGALGEAAYTHASQCEGFLEEVVRNASRWWRDGPREEAWTHQLQVVCGGPGCKAKAPQYAASFGTHRPTRLSAVGSQRVRLFVLGLRPVRPACQPHTLRPRHAKSEQE